jgi:hypothetical protein
LIGTDGAADLEAAAEARLPGREEPLGPLAQFWEQDRYYENADAVRRRLFLANREAPRMSSDAVAGQCRPGTTSASDKPLLPDDTTLVVLRRPREG